MTTKSAGTKENQGIVSEATSEALKQLTIPLTVASEAIQKGLLAFVHQMGLLAFSELLASEAATIVGSKGKHLEGRGYHHWGSASTALPFGGRRVVIRRPRVRGARKGAREVELPSIQAARASDPMPIRVAEQILVGVSTRGYKQSLDEVDESITTRGESKSHVSRALVDRTGEMLAKFLSQRLDSFKPAAIFIDGIEIGKHAVMIALGLGHDGHKLPLGVWCGSTENHVITADLMQDLIGRGLCVDRPVLFVIDGGKGIRKALDEVFGDRAVIQRCQVHKARNVRGHLPKERQSYVQQQMREAYRNRSPKVAKKLLLQLASWLDSNGEDSAAASLREGLDETLTVLRLGVPLSLSRSLATTNPIENLNAALRRTARNVKRWQGENMIRRWVALGIERAERGFLRIKGYSQIGKLLEALSPNEPKSNLSVERKVA